MRIGIVFLQLQTCKSFRNLFCTSQSSILSPWEGCLLHWNLLETLIIQKNKHVKAHHSMKKLITAILVLHIWRGQTDFCCNLSIQSSQEISFNDTNHGFWHNFLKLNFLLHNPYNGIIWQAKRSPLVCSILCEGDSFLCSTSD